MKPRLLTLLAVCILALAACERAKPRHPPPDPMAVPPPPPAAAAPPREGASAGLPKRPEFAAFSVERIGSAVDPRNRRPAVVAAGQPVTILGAAFDPVSKAPARGVDVVVDGTVWRATYGDQRPNAPRYSKIPGLTAVGFTVTLPAKVLAPGPHTATVRVVAADGKSYFEGRRIAFQVR